MQTTFKNKKMVIKHPSGVISEYAATNLQARKDQIHSRITELNAEISKLDLRIASIDASAAD